jgi:uncharacterized Zn finger protein (UPF0148 family)
MGCDRLGAPSGEGTTVTAARPVPAKGMKVCFNCDGAGRSPCFAAGCKRGMVDCPGPCLKLSSGTWQHMHVEGHSDSELWQTFRGIGGTRSWNQGHVGEVIEMQAGSPVNVGKCKTCGGAARVKCSTCAGTGEVGCSICDGQKVVPETWTAFNNPKQKNQPKMIRLKDGRTIYGKIQSTMGSTIYVKTESGQEVLQASDILSSRTNTPPK